MLFIPLFSAVGCIPSDYDVREVPTSTVVTADQTLAPLLQGCFALDEDVCPRDLDTFELNANCVAKMNVERDGVLSGMLRAAGGLSFDEILQGKIDATVLLSLLVFGPGDDRRVTVYADATILFGDHQTDLPHWIGNVEGGFPDFKLFKVGSMRCLGGESYALDDEQYQNPVATASFHEAAQDEPVFSYDADSPTYSNDLIMVNSKVYEAPPEDESFDIPEQEYYHIEQSLSETANASSSMLVPTRELFGYHDVESFFEWQIFYFPKHD